MRRLLIAGNWKMHLSAAKSVALAEEILHGEVPRSVDVAVCPPFVYLTAVGEVVRGSSVQLGAQNVHYADQGAFTGEVSPSMLLDVGCQCVILGHSERRQLFAETDVMVNRKLEAVMKAGLTAIVCVGETLAQREAGETFRVIASQMAGSVGSIPPSLVDRLVVAYEPVWAIGTGKTATPEQAQEVHADLRNWLQSRYNSSLAAATRIIYGGSVKPENAEMLLKQPDIDGALVGGASLSAKDFLEIVAAGR